DSLGQELRRKREEHHISLREISEQTRIGLRFLHAIEADDYTGIPGGIYARSFIRAYAKCVGMDEEEAIGFYRKQTNQVVEDEMIELQVSRDFPSEPSQMSLGLVVLALLGIIALVGYGAVRYFKPADTVSTAQTVPAAASASKPAQSAAQPPSQTPAPAQQPATQQPAPVTTTPVTDTSSAQQPAQTQPGQTQQPPQTDAGLIVAFTATDRCWLSVQSDDKSPTQTLNIQQ